MNDDKRQLFGDLGFPFPKNIIMAYLGGSEAHGAKLPGKSDTDWYGVFIENPEHALGLSDYPHYTTSTGDADGRNKPSDVDMTFYSLRKWAGLAAKGNPSCLHFLFAPKYFHNIFWDSIEIHKRYFVSKDSMGPFLGFANAQYLRMVGEKGQKNVSRPELEAEFGYDTKYAMHVVRLFGEAKELMETGSISLPRPNKDLLIDIRLGKYKFEEIKDMAKSLEADALSARDRSPLPEHVDKYKISKLLAFQHQMFWDSQEKA